jgi:hypothetical protein
MKMDVEGDEVDSILHMADATLERIDKIAIELHDFDHAQDVTKLIAAVSRDFGSSSTSRTCTTTTSAVRLVSSRSRRGAYEALFVSKRIGVVDQTGAAVTLPNPADSPNHPTMPDCQPGSRR